MNSRRHSPLIPLTFLILVVVALAAIGALLSYQNHLRRGIPNGLPEPTNDAGVRLGANVYLWQVDQESLAEELAAVRQAGFVVIRQPFYYSEGFDWAASDRIVEAAEQAQLELVPLLDGDPANDFAPPDAPEDFAAWAGQFADRYGDQIDSYVIWDEPNLTTHWGNRPVNPADYAALLSAAAGAIRESDPNSLIVAAPLAPTVETGPKNLSDVLFLESLYEFDAAQAFDVAAAKPYGFDTAPSDRTVDPDVLNFSRAILLREVMLRHDDGASALWAGNWGWNSLPPDWQGRPSIWGQVQEETRAQWTVDALERARREWPWMGAMFLENWKPDAPPDDPLWGFSIAGSPTAAALSEVQPSPDIAYPGYYPARPDDPSQVYQGSWRFSPDYGADVGGSGDKATFRFWGSDVGLRVRRSDRGARFYATIDGRPANALPSDENGTVLVLNATAEGQDEITTDWVARDLPPQEHTLTIVADQGQDQWALVGLSVGYLPLQASNPLALATLAGLALILLFLALLTGRRADWGRFGRTVGAQARLADQRLHLALTAGCAALVALAGWLTWGEEAAGLYRRLGDGWQLALTAAAASIFYVAPSFLVYVTALVILFFLIYSRPAWGIALIAFSIPYYVRPKPMLGYRFSPVEIFVLVTTAACLARWLTVFIAQRKASGAVTWSRPKIITADLSVLLFVAAATLSLLFTERLDVATNEWRVAIVEPALLYGLLRFFRLQDDEMWTVIDAFVLGGLLVALIGLWQYATGQNLITGEGGLMRLRSIYGSPNNAALYLGRILPILAAVSLMGQGKRRFVYAFLILPISAAIVLTFSKGSLFLGIPASLLMVFILWRRSVSGRLWPWLVGAAVAGLGALVLLFRSPQLAARLNPQGATSVFRLSLWRASLNMFADHPIFGVGLDNFLYAYRSRYIFRDAWQEPNLSHPHNLLLDFATRLGVAGLLTGGWMFWNFWRTAWKLPKSAPRTWRPVAVGILGSLIYILVHGLVDHSFFLVDLAFAFFLLFGIAVWLDWLVRTREPDETSVANGG